MPFATTAAADAALDAVVATLPVGTLRLYAGIPEAATELTSDGGYAPAAHDPSDWAAASGGMVTTTAPVDLGTSTAAWSDVATCWAVCDDTGAIWLWDYLTAPISVTAPRAQVSFSPSIYFRNDI